MSIKRDDLGYLGVEYQYRLIHHFMDDKKFFRDMCDIVDSNMFTDVNLRKFVATLKDYYLEHDYVPTYDTMFIELNHKTKSDQELEFVSSVIDKLKDTPSEGADSIKDKAQKFFKQQNLAKVVNKLTEIIKVGDIERYNECEELITNALATGNRDEIGVRLKENMGEVLSEDYRKTIPTGIEWLDEKLEGGLGKGELAVIIGGAGFGKTSFTTAIANNSAKIGYKTVQIVFEDKEKQIQRKHYGKITGIEAKDISKPENVEMVKEQLNNTTDFDDNLIIKKFNTGEVTVPMIRNYLKRLLNTGFKADLVIIDYFECLASTKQFKDIYQGEGHTMRQLESLADDLDIALWVPTQGTKDSLSADIVTMDKAGGSFKKMQIAHIVMSIARTVEDIENNIATIALLKNRSGKSGAYIENIYFNNGTCVIDTSRAKSFNSTAEYKESEEEKMTELKSNLLEKSRLNREQVSNGKGDTVPF